MAGSTFVLREPEAHTETAVYLIFRYQNRRVRIRTKLSILPKFWNKETQRARNTKSFPQNMAFNASLENIQTVAFKVYRNYLDDHKGEPEPSTLKKAIELELFGSQERSFVPTTFKPFFEFYIKQAAKKTNEQKGEPISQDRKRLFQNTLQIIKEFEKEKGFQCEFETIDLNFYETFYEFLEERKYALNTMGKIIKAIKTVLNDATARGINTNLFFRSRKFSAPEQINPAVYLDQNELAQLHQLDISDNPKLERAKDLFLVGCWTGLRFSDWDKINTDNIQEDDYVEVKTEKTGQTVIIPLHSTVKEILKKYNYQLPRNISNAKANQYIKDVCRKVNTLHGKVEKQITKGGRKITKQVPKYQMISTHTARRSFATNLYKQGMDSITIMAITGHKKESDLLRYIRVTPSESAEKVKKLFNGNDQRSNLQVH